MLSRKVDVYIDHLSVMDRCHCDRVFGIGLNAHNRHIGLVLHLHPSQRTHYNCIKLYASLTYSPSNEQKYSASAVKKEGIPFRCSSAPSKAIKDFDRHSVHQRNI